MKKLLSVLVSCAVLLTSSFSTASALSLEEDIHEHNEYANSDNVHFEWNIELDEDERIG